MDLALLVYGISLLKGISSLLAAVLVLSIISFILILVFSVNFFDASEDNLFLKTNLSPSEKTIKKIAIWLAVIIGFTGLLGTAVPSEKTAYMMVAAYTVQKIAQDPNVVQTGEKIITIINQKLDSYIDEGEKKAKKKIKETLEK